MIDPNSRDFENRMGSLTRQMKSGDLSNQDPELLEAARQALERLGRDKVKEVDERNVDAPNT